MNNPIISNPCTICKHKISTILFIESLAKIENISTSLRVCDRCKTVFYGDYSNTYEDDLYAYYQKYLGLRKDSLFNSETRKSFIKVLRLLRSYGCGISILDVGCGKGDFVDAALSEGYNVEGIELSDLAIQIAQVYGLPVRKQNFFSSEIAKSSKDLVTMFEVIEHLPDPVAFLRRAEEVVKPGGLIYLTTPNFDSLDKKILGMKWDVIHPEHLTYFNKKTLLQAIMANTTLELEYIETRNISQQSISYLRSVVKKSVRPGSTTLQINYSSENNPSKLREKIANSSSLSFIKRLINYFLNLLSFGSTIIVILRRPR